MAQFLVVLAGVWLIAVGLVAFCRPLTANRLVRKAASTNLINYTELTLRGMGGLALVWSAEVSRFPEVFRVYGWVVVATTAVLLLVPREWHARYAIWCSERLTPSYLRIASPVSIGLGIFLIYAVL